MSKFKNTEGLEKAYQELEREFTKKSQKLALYEKTNYVTLLNKEMDSLVDDYAKRRISDLEAKLAESKEQVEIVEKEQSELLMTIFNSHKENFELKQQLAEKKKEYKESVEKILSSRDKFILEYNQDKISFCIEQLDKVKEFVKETSGIVGHEWRIDRFRVLEQIDNQIASLKNGVE